MSKPDKQRVGLQRKVSSVFKDVTIPGEKRTNESSPVPNKDINGVASSEAMPENGPIPSVRQYEEDNLPSNSWEPEATQSTASEGPAPVEKATDDADPERTAESAPPVSKEPQNEQSSLMKKLAQSEEPEDTIVCPLSASAKPEVAQALASGKTVDDEAGDSVQQTPNKKQAPQNSLMKRLAQSEEPANEDVTEDKADIPLSIKPKRDASFDSKSKNEHKSETLAVSTAQNKHPLADQLSNAVDEGGFLQQLKEKVMPSEEEGGSAKDKVMIMLIPILAIAMVFAFRNVFQNSPGKVSAAKKKDEKVVVVAKSGEDIDWKIPDPLPVMTRDPLQLPQDDDTKNQDETAGSTGSERETVKMASQIRNGIVNVRTIVYSEDRASALIGDRIVYDGSKIDGVTIIKINRNSVEFECNGETWVQRVHD